MRFFARSAALLVLCVFGVCAGSSGAGPAVMADPLIGLSFNPEQVHFERLPASPAATKAGLGDQWIFASYRQGGSDTAIYIVSGFIKIAPDGAGEPVSEPGFGAVIRMDGRRLKVLGVPDRLFGSKPLLPADVVELLMSDAVERYSRAFGPERLGQLIADQRIALDDLPAVLVRKLAERGIAIGSTAGARK